MGRHAPSRCWRRRAHCRPAAAAAGPFDHHPGALGQALAHPQAAIAQFLGTHGAAREAALGLLHEHHLLAVDQQYRSIGQRDTALGRHCHLRTHVLARLETARTVVQLGARLHHAAFAVDEVIHVLQGRLQRLPIGAGHAHLHARLQASGQALGNIQQQPQAVRIANHRQRLFAVGADRHARAHPPLHQHAIDRRAQRQALVDVLAVAIRLGEGGRTRMIGLAAGEVGLGLVQFTARRHTRRMQFAGAVQFLARLLQLGAATHALRLGLAELGRGDPGNHLAGLHLLPRLRLDARHLPRQRRAQRAGAGLVPDHPARQLQAGAGTGGHRSLRSTSSWRLPAGNWIWPALICGASSV
jgi:hypothetical protein